jgi:hypothetical protein
MRVERCLDRVLLATFICCALLAPAGATAQDRMCERTVKANVVALREQIWLNRLGANIPDGMIYALARDVVDGSGRSCDNEIAGDPKRPPVTEACRAPGASVHLRDDKRTRPIVLRANEGDCLQIAFTNLLASSGGATLKSSAAGALSTLGAEAPLAVVERAKESAANQRLRQDAQAKGKLRTPPPPSPKLLGVAVESVATAAAPELVPPPTTKAGVHVQGLSWVTGAKDDGSYVGVNANSLVAPGEWTTYTLFAEHEGSYLLYSTADDWTNPNLGNGGADGGTLAQGLFGSVNVQPSGSAVKPFGKKWDAEWYRSQATEQDLCLASQDGVYNPTTGRCARRTPDALPVINYQALYPDDPAHFPLNRNLPILNMLCTTVAVAKGACQENEIVHSDLTAIITGPNAGHFPSTIPPADQPPALRAISLLPDRLQPYREFTIIYHESFVVEQAFASLYDNPKLPSLGSAEDNFGINYGMGGIASEILANRIGVGPMKDCLECKYEEFFLSSWTVGDPAMNVDVPASDCVAGDKPIPGCTATRAKYPDDPSNVYPSYLGDHVRFRVLHGGSDLHHIHHQHAHQWLHTPNSPNADYTDSQSFGPGSAFTMEMAYYGSGNVNQTVGDSIFHCHFYAHFASGMWSMWRVFDTLQTGTPLDGAGKPAAGVRAYPDGEIAAGTPIPAVVPVPTLPMPLPPAPVRLVDGGKGFEVQLVDAQGRKGSWVSSLQGGIPDQVYRNPGYPFFVPAIAGHRPPHPPLDLAYACSDNGLRCAPGTVGEPRDLSLCQNPATAKCEPLDGGLPRHLIAAGSDSTPALNNTDFSKILTQTKAFQIAEEGSLVEQIAMRTHSQRLYSTCLPDGRCSGVCSDNGAPCSVFEVGGRWQCANPTTATCVDRPITYVLNGLPPKPGAPYADPCIRFDRNGGAAPDMLTRRYQAADIQLDAIFNKEGWHYPQERMIALWGDVKSFLDRQKAPEPFFFRANSNDCIEYTLANLVPNVYELDDFQVRTPTDILGQHIHLVKFDVTSSDGAANGWNYEDGTFAPNEVTERITAIDKAGGIDRKFVGGGAPQPLTAKSIKFFGDGPGGTWIGAQATIQRWFADPLYDNAGACSNNPDLPCTLVDLSRCGNPTATCDVTAGFCANNQQRTCTAVTSLARCGKPGECIARHDRTIRTVFTHDHFGPSTHQQAGLYAGLVVEPEGSVWRDNQTGTIFGGYDAATGRNIVNRFDGGPTSWQAVVETPKKDQSFREFLLELQDSTLTYQPFAVRDFILDPRDPNWRAQFAGGVTGPCHAGEPCGFCGNDGVCVNTQTGLPVTPVKTCLVPVPYATSDPCKTTGQACRLFAGVAASGSQPAVAGQLVACTPENFTACQGQSYDDANADAAGVFKSCKLLSGMPAIAWGTTAVDPPNNNTPEVITFFGATNDFSFNYRDEPLYPRTTDPYAGTVLTTGNSGDLSYVFSSSSSISRPNLLGSACSGNLGMACGTSKPCPSSAGTCQAASFCSDNFALCTAGNKTLCRNPATAQCNRSFPYPALTPDVAAGDPFTPLLRAYAGDDLQIRTLTGAHLNPHNFTVQGMNWLMQPSFVDSGWRNSQVMGISEHFDLMTRVPPAYSRGTTDFLYQPGAAALEQAAGNWGLLRAYDTRRGDLHALPQNSAPAAAAYGVCPQGSTPRSYSVMALTAQQVLGSSGLVYNDGSNNGNIELSDANAILFFNAAGPVLRCSNPANPASCGQLPITCNGGTSSTAGTCSNNSARSCHYASQCVEPLVLRAAAGDCIKVDLYNDISPTTTIAGVSALQTTVPYGCALRINDKDGNPLTCNGAGQPPCCTAAASNVSFQVGFRAQLVASDARNSGGFNVGQNPISSGGNVVETAAPGQKVAYTWYAGNVDAKATAAQRYIPIEFGASNLLAPDVMNHYFHALIGGLVVEPAGSSGWEQSGVEAYVKEKDGSGFREFVVFTQDNLNSGGPFEAVNYGSELIATGASAPIRLCESCPTTDFSCLFTGKPFVSSGGTCTAFDFAPQTPVFTACAGESVRFRLLHPGGINTNQVFEIYGHTWSESPYETEYDHCEAPTTQTNLWASQKQGTTNLCANQPYSLAKLAAAQRTQGEWEASLNAWQGSRMGQGPTNHLDILLAQAGGPFRRTGTYLYRTFPAMHFGNGLWGWFNVVDPSQNAKCGSTIHPDTSLKNQLPTTGGGAE